MNAARRRRKAHRQAAFWAEREDRARRAGTLTVTITADADRFLAGLNPFPPQARRAAIESQIRETNRAAMRLLDHHVDQVLAELATTAVPAAFTRVDVGHEYPGANFPIHHTIGLPREDHQ